MKTSHALLVLLLVLLSHASPASAQSGDIRPGVRVRIAAPGVVANRLDATVISSTADTLTVASSAGALLAVPVSRIISLEINRGRSRTDGAIFGAEIGSVFSVAIGLFALSTDCTNCGSSPAVPNVLEGVITYATFGAVIGAIAGRERWEALDLRPHTSIGIHNGRPTLAMTVPF